MFTIDFFMLNAYIAYLNNVLCMLQMCAITTSKPMDKTMDCKLIIKIPENFTYHIEIEFTDERGILAIL